MSLSLFLPLTSFYVVKQKGCTLWTTPLAFVQAFLYTFQLLPIKRRGIHCEVLARREFLAFFLLTHFEISSWREYFLDFMLCFDHFSVALSYQFCKCFLLEHNKYPNLSITQIPIVVQATFFSYWIEFVFSLMDEWVCVTEGFRSGLVGLQLNKKTFSENENERGWMERGVRWSENTEIDLKASWKIIQNYNLNIQGTSRSFEFI